MKKVLIILFFIIFGAINFCSAKSYYNAQTSAGIKMYKNRNYTECLQVMYDVVNKDPSNVLAYYYIAISQARLGQTAKAQEAYQRVIDLNSSTQLTRYATKGIQCLNDPSSCSSDAGNAKKTSDLVNTELNNMKIKTIQNSVNQNKNIQDVSPDMLYNLKDYSKPQNQIQNKSEIPTKEEIADAIDTLKRAGYQNIMPQPAMTPEMIQMNMINSLTNNQPSTNPMMNFMPYTTQNSQTQQIDPQVMQAMMMNSMMGGLYTDYNQR